MISLVSGASIAKNLFQQVGPESTSVARLAMATIFMFLFWRPWRFKLSKAQLKAIMLYGSCLGVMNFTFYLAISRLPIGLAIALEFLGPLSIAILSSRKKMDFAWIALASLGIVLILPGSDFGQLSQGKPIDLLGVVFALIAATCWALYIVLGKRTSQVAPTALAAPYGMLFGFILVLPFGATNIPQLFGSFDLIALSACVGILSSALPYSLEMVALRKLPTQQFSLLLSLEPAIGALAGFFFLSEVLTLQQLFAITCVIVASAGSTWTSRPRPTPEAMT